MRCVVLNTNCLIQILPTRSLYRRVWTDFLEGKYRLCHRMGGGFCLAGEQ
ncbi:MAG: hypothetical protein IKH33_02775 [Bacteroidales bacterium]|nr:hypothetical protein [Bacteroidales bacterium]